MVYKRNSNSYFRQLPDLDYPSLSNDRTSSYDYIKVKNIFKRAVMRDDVFDSYVAFEKYSIEGDERPDNVAQKFYNDPNLDWIILITNNIISVREQWPMSQNDLYTYLEEKYTDQQMSYIHHYETQLVVDSEDKLIQPAGYWVDSDYTVSFVDKGTLKTISNLKSVSYIQHEINLNEKKRQIDLLKEDYLQMFISDNSEIMEYKESQQYINDKLKKTENPRFISP
tara:strand:- start:1837 stop:2511 length:675 start_codon:yes stop_codon:yes gene_type:complete